MTCGQKEGVMTFYALMVCEVHRAVIKAVMLSQGQQVGIEANDFPFQIKHRTF